MTNLTAEKIDELAKLHATAFRTPRHLNTPYMNALEDAAPELLRLARLFIGCTTGCTWFAAYREAAKGRVESLRRAEEAEAVALRYRLAIEQHQRALLTNTAALGQVYVPIDEKLWEVLYPDQNTPGNGTDKTMGDF